MLHVLFLTASSRNRERIAELLSPAIRLTVASPGTELRSAPGPDVGLFDMDVGRPALRRWRRQASYRLPVVLLVRDEEKKRRALEDDVTDVLVWGDLSSLRLRSFCPPRPSGAEVGGSSRPPSATGCSTKRARTMAPLRRCHRAPPRRPLRSRSPPP